MFPIDLITDMVFHQDKSSSHTSKHGVKVHLYRRFQKVIVVTPREWKHKGPDASPIDFAIWESLQDTLRSERNLHFSKS